VQDQAELLAELMRGEHRIITNNNFSLDWNGGAEEEEIESNDRELFPYKMMSNVTIELREKTKPLSMKFIVIKILPVIIAWSIIGARMTRTSASR